MSIGRNGLRVGLSLHGASLSEAGARFASQLGVRDVVVHLTDYARNADNTAYLAGGVGPINGECIDAPLWSYEHIAGLVAMMARHGLSVAAMENISPNVWSDILLDGPKKHEQMEAMKQLQRLFRVSEGCSVFEYVRVKRLEAALAALSAGATTVKEASLIAGYSSAANFATAFRRQFGMTPTEALRPRRVN